MVEADVDGGHGGHGQLELLGEVLVDLLDHRGHGEHAHLAALAGADRLLVLLVGKQRPTVSFFLAFHLATFHALVFLYKLY